MFKTLAFGISICLLSLSAIADNIPSEKVLTERFEQAGIVKNDQWVKKGDDKSNWKTYRASGDLFYMYDSRFGAALISEKEPSKEQVDASLLSCLAIPAIAFDGLSVERKDKALATIKTAYLEPNEWSEDVIDGLMFKVKKSTLGGYPILYCDVESFNTWD
ncbi:hypothetical protein [Gibbsiella quercinecans]|uniref:hypothetical protein n=1 Tax=Gibbsiella quercinecans TaxID=929813 RepID=UPI0011C464E8|nr:hypothetical protein [Gibbsiella quercinecans]